MPAGRSLPRGVQRYFFHLYDDMTVIDEEGAELSGMEAARKKALADAREMACAEVLEGHLDLRHRIEVADESGEVLFTVQYRDTVDVRS